MLNYYNLLSVLTELGVFNSASSSNFLFKFVAISLSNVVFSKDNTASIYYKIVIHSNIGIIFAEFKSEYNI